jgi:hypothetical protein
MDEKKFNEIDSLEIEPLSDEALELVAGGDSSSGPVCCSCTDCSSGPRPVPVEPVDPVLS